MNGALRTCWAFLARDVQISISYRLDFAMRLFSALFVVLILYFVSKFVGPNPIVNKYGGYMPFAAVGMAVMSFFQTGFRSFSMAIRAEQMMGTLEALLMTPTRLWLIALGSSLWNFIWGLVTIGVYLLAVALLFDVDYQGNFALALLLLLLTTLVFSCFGIISASFIMAFKRGDPLPFLVGTISTLFGGVLFPIELLPEPLRVVSHLLPVTYGLHGMREILLRGQTLATVAPQLLILVIFVAVSLPLSLLCFAAAVRHARRESSLLVY